MCIYACTLNFEFYAWLTCMIKTLTWCLTKKIKDAASRSRVCPGAAFAFAHCTLLLPSELQWSKLQGAEVDVQHILLVALVLSALNLQQTNPQMTKAGMKTQIKLHNKWWMLFTFLCPKVSVRQVNNLILTQEPFRDIKPLLQSFSCSFMGKLRHSAAAFEDRAVMSCLKWLICCPLLVRHFPQWTLKHSLFLSSISF